MKKILYLLVFIAAPAYADQSVGVGVPIQVRIIQCGTQAQAAEHCQTDEPKCCAVVMPAAGFEEDTPSTYSEVTVTPEHELYALYEVIE